MGQPDQSAQPDPSPGRRPDLPSDFPSGAEIEGLLSETREGGLDLAVPEPSAVDAGVPMISFSHVSISFGDRKVLDNVSFTLKRGQTLCILGRSGVGKSVSLRILMGFLKPQVGSIRVEGEEINGLDEEGMQAIRKRVTMVFQNGALFDSLTVRENIAFPLRERGGMAEDQVQQLVDRLTGLVGADDVSNDLPGSLSTGRKRAVAIARALAAQPEVVLYDEPTTMVDPIIAKRLGGLIQKLKYQLGYTSIVVTHDMRFAERLADQVLFLHQGRASFFGPLNSFLASRDENIQQFLALDAYRIPSA
jgi:phospholipid/cholesterol/gamma-HCH transport system ATP-binding protein